MESIIIVDCSVKDIDFLVKAVNKKKAYVVVTANDAGVRELLGQLANLNIAKITNVAWVYGDNSNVPAFVAKGEVVKVLDLVKSRSDGFVGLHMVGLGAHEAPPDPCPWRFFDRVGVKVTASRNLNGAAYHLIQPTPVFERAAYFTDLVDYFPLVQVDEATTQCITSSFKHLDKQCRNRDFLELMEHDLLNHRNIVSKIICAILMKYQALKNPRYDKDLVHNLSVLFEALFTMLVGSGTLDPAFKKSLVDIADSDFEEKVYIIVAILVVNYGIDPASVAQFCAKYNIESVDMFLGYIRCGQVVFYNGADRTERATHDICMPMMKKDVPQSTFFSAKCVMLSPRTRLVIHGQAEFEGKTVIFENDSFTEDKVVNSQRWFFEFQSYTIAVIDRTAKQPPAARPEPRPRPEWPA